MLLRQSPLISSSNLSPIERRPNFSPLPSSLSSKGFPTPRLRGLRALPPRPSLQRCASKQSDAAAVQEEPLATEAEVVGEGVETRQEVILESAGLSVGIGGPSTLGGLVSYRMSLGDQAFFLLAFIACTTSVAFTSFIIAAIPTLLAVKRAALSLARLADTAREELPSTMAAIRLSGMEISDLTLELSDLSQEIADGINKSAQAVQAAEAGIRQIGSIARRQTVSMIQERANLPDISLKPMVAGAAKKTSHVVGQAKKTIMNFISRGDSSDNGDMSDKVEI
ncbi:hypothetical protein Cni_G20267 [Canna indica]|uniref:Uncharacterized protein n=1 Tax=Canna indica TaxID=4628 RepID=A0AAQ3QHM0_9LILI|nr:hypothetical protein Cni_G20267 [Canna indica]